MVFARVAEYFASTPTHHGLVDEHKSSLDDATSRRLPPLMEDDEEEEESRPDYLHVCLRATGFDP